MSWVRLDDNFPNHPKVIGLSDEAFRVYVSGLCYASHYLTDGLLKDAVVRRLGWVIGADELVSVGLWSTTKEGWQIASYGEYQSSKSDVEKAKQANRERVARWQEKQKANGVTNGVTNGISNDLIIEPHIHTHIHKHKNNNNEEKLSSNLEVDIPTPRVKSAKEAVERIVVKLAEARKNGINAWNLTRLVEDEWDKLHGSDDMGGALGLTVWYVSELLSRPLQSDEISRIGQMTKRFGRIALLAIDEASSKNPEDLVSYAFRVAQNMYKEGVK